FQSLFELMGEEPALRGRVTQALGDLLAVGIRCSQTRSPCHVARAPHPPSGGIHESVSQTRRGYAVRTALIPPPRRCSRRTAGACSNGAQAGPTTSGRSLPSLMSASTSGITARAWVRPKCSVTLRAYICSAGMLARRWRLPELVQTPSGAVRDRATGRWVALTSITSGESGRRRSSRGDTASRPRRCACSRTLDLASTRYAFLAPNARAIKPV